MENVKKYRDIKFVVNEKKKKLFSAGNKVSHNKFVFREFVSNLNE